MQHDKKRNFSSLIKVIQEHPKTNPAHLPEQAQTRPKTAHDHRQPKPESKHLTHTRAPKLNQARAHPKQAETVPAPEDHPSACRELHSGHTGKVFSLECHGVGYNGTHGGVHTASAPDPNTTASRKNRQHDRHNRERRPVPRTGKGHHTRKEQHLRRPFQDRRRQARGRKAQYDRHHTTTGHV